MEPEPKKLPVTGHAPDPQAILSSPRTRREGECDTSPLSAKLDREFGGRSTEHDDSVVFAGIRAPVRSKRRKRNRLRPIENRQHKKISPHHAGMNRWGKASVTRAHSLNNNSSSHRGDTHTKHPFIIGTTSDFHEATFAWLLAGEFLDRSPKLIKDEQTISVE